MTLAERTSGQSLRLLFRVCILCGLWLWHTEGHVCIGKRLLENSDGDDEEQAAVDVQRWPTELSLSGARRHPGDGAQHSVIIGLLNEDGSFNSSYVGSDLSMCRDDQWEEEEEGESTAYDGEGLKPSEVGRLEKSDQVETYNFEKCPAHLRDYIPCFQDAAKGEGWDRHCPEEQFRLRCILAKPSGYKPPIRWPASKDEVLASNVPRQAGIDNWVIVENSKLKFPTDQVRFPDGIDGYLDKLAQMVPDVAFGVKTRTALDVGCGVGSLAAGLVARGVLPLSICPEDVHKSVVQIALERGIPAMVAALATHRLAYPSQAFDLVHCSDCGIQWTRDGGLLLIEINRLLRAGRYFSWSAPVENSHELMWDEMEDLAKRLCWTRVAREGRVAVWQKPHSNSCYRTRSAPAASPPMCDPNEDPDSVWGIALRRCISWLPTTISGLSDWPARLSVLPERTSTALMDADLARRDVFLARQRHWNDIVAGYLRGLGLRRQHIRNAMDATAGFGWFAAALVDQRPDWWVMNVVPTHGPDSLKVVFDRGLLGVAHDWCEPFDTYPRTYDLLHAVGLFTLEKDRCDLARIVLEMDRILRPGGWVLIREPKPMARRVEALARSVHWRTRMLETESGPFGKDKLLSCVKRR